MKYRILRRLVSGVHLAVLALGTAGTVAAQSPPGSRAAEVELPLATYDELRAAAKSAREKPAAEERPTLASARLVKAAFVVDLAGRRATWDAELFATSVGDTPPAVPLVGGAVPLSRFSVSPEGAVVEATGDAVLLRVSDEGRYKVLLSGEVVSGSEDESAGIAFPVPALASLPAAFDVTWPEGALASVAPPATLGPSKTANGRVTARLTLEREKPTTLFVRRPRAVETEAARVNGTVHTIDRIAEDGIRSEVRLALKVRRGVLTTRTLLLPGASLVSAQGPVIATGPATDGTFTLRFEPPVGPKGEVNTSWWARREWPVSVSWPTCAPRAARS